MGEAFAGGALLTMMAEAFRYGDRQVGRVTTLGFVLHSSSPRSSEGRDGVTAAGTVARVARGDPGSQDRGYAGSWI
jgi:hypothetical protein